MRFGLGQRDLEIWILIVRLLDTNPLASSAKNDFPPYIQQDYVVNVNKFSGDQNQKL